LGIVQKVRGWDAEPKKCLPCASGPDSNVCATAWLAQLARITGQDEALRHYHLFDATLGELYRRAGDRAQARRHFEAAKQKTQSLSDHEVINRRLAQC
jgi:predicted RNA polymerase sigma factor